MAATALEVADILRRFTPTYERRFGSLSPHHQRVVRDLIVCRTAELGGHRYVCDRCQHVVERYNSCRNRHCPKCQNLERERWLEKRRSELLPVAYFHLVFTVPHELNPLFLTAPNTLYHLLFRTASQSLLELARDSRHLGARLGFLAVLHTWGQRLDLHPHLHVIVPGGGLSPSGDRWVHSRPDFFLPVIPLARLFRGKFLDAVRKAANQGQSVFPRRLDPAEEPSAYQAWLDGLYATSWNVYSKPPFGGAKGGLEYVGRYSHRVAISNHRLLRIENGRVVFRWKDYRDDGQQKLTSLAGVEFIRRYLMHVLPVGFQRIRSYGLLANRHRSKNLEQCRWLLGVSAPVEEMAGDSADGAEESLEAEIERLTGLDPRRCPACGEGRLSLLAKVASKEDQLLHSARAPP
jgi:hypothetical protein